MYGQLGDIVFENSLSPSSQELTGAAVYAEHARITGKPRLQRTGDSLDEIKLGMKLHFSFCDPEAVIKQLVNYRNDGYVCRYITGYGRLIGNFVIVSIKQTDASSGPNGKLIETDLELSLLESSVQDAESAAISAAVSSGVAMAGNNPVEKVVAITPLTATAIAGAEAVAVNAGTNGLQEQIKAAQVNTSMTENMLGKSKQQAAKMQDSLARAINSVNMTTLAIYDRTRQFEAACLSMLASVTTFKEACEAGDLTAAAAALIGVTTSNASISTSAEVLAEIQSTRIPVPTNG